VDISYNTVDISVDISYNTVDISVDISYNTVDISDNTTLRRQIRAQLNAIMALFIVPWSVFNFFFNGAALWAMALVATGSAADRQSTCFGRSAWMVAVAGHFSLSLSVCLCHSLGNCQWFNKVR
jgi:hypothetical protein